MIYPISWEHSWPYLAAALAFGYLLGSIPFGVILTRLAGLGDIRAIGSGHIGATNVLRPGNKPLAALTLLLDAAKGAAAVLLAAGFGPDPAVLAGYGALLGHLFPVWLGFRGGKGVATTCGVFSVLAPQATAIAGVAFIMTVWWTRYISLGSVVATALLGPLAYLTGASAITVAAALIVGAIVIHRHRSNLSRVFEGIERRIGQRA